MVDLTPIKIVSQEVKPGITEQRVEAVFHISEEPKHEWKVFFSAGTWSKQGGLSQLTRDNPEVSGSDITAVATEATLESVRDEVRAHLDSANATHRQQVIEPQIERGQQSQPRPRPLRASARSWRIGSTRALEPGRGHTIGHRLPITHRDLAA